MVLIQKLLCSVAPEGEPACPPLFKRTPSVTVPGRRGGSNQRVLESRGCCGAKSVSGRQAWRWIEQNGWILGCRRWNRESDVVKASTGVLAHAAAQ